MKKIFLLGLMVFISMTLNCFAGNVMDTDSYSFTVISMADADVEPPYTTDHFPAKGAVGMSINTKPSVHIKDDLTGVDINSIVMKVNGSIVSINVLGDKNDYSVEGSPGVLAWDEIVNVTVDCVDLSNNQWLHSKAFK